MHTLLQDHKVYECSRNLAPSTDPDFVRNIDTARRAFEELDVSKPDLIKESLAFHPKGLANPWSNKEIHE